MEAGTRDSGLGIRNTYVQVLVLEAVIVVLLWIFERVFS